MIWIFWWLATVQSILTAVHHVCFEIIKVMLLKHLAHCFWFRHFNRVSGRSGMIKVRCAHRILIQKASCHRCCRFLCSKIIAFGTRGTYWLPGRLSLYLLSLATKWRTRAYPLPFSSFLIAGNLTHLTLGAHLAHRILFIEHLCPLQKQFVSWLSRLYENLLLLFDLLHRAKETLTKLLIEHLHIIKIQRHLPRSLLYNHRMGLLVAYLELSRLTWGVALEPIRLHKQESVDWLLLLLLKTLAASSCAF